MTSGLEFRDTPQSIQVRLVIVSSAPPAARHGEQALLHIEANGTARHACHVSKLSDAHVRRNHDSII